MSFRLFIVTAPTVEPVTVAEVKTHTHISHDEEDGLISDWIRSGRELAESYQRRAYLEQVIRLSWDSFPRVPICVPRSPLISLEAVSYFDSDSSETAFSVDNFIVDTDGEPGRLMLVDGVYWPSVTLRTINSVHVRIKAGYGITADSVPRNVKDAILLYCSFRDENRAGEENEIPDTFFNLLQHDRL